jgi:hypothetical protein
MLHSNLTRPTTFLFYIFDVVLTLYVLSVNISFSFSRVDKLQGDINYFSITDRINTPNIFSARFSSQREFGGGEGKVERYQKH